MGKYTIDDPDDSGTKSVDGQGRLYLGEGYENAEVEYAVKVKEEDN